MTKENRKSTGILLIGQNYRKSSTPLNGCINDAENIEKFLLDQGYPKINIETLTDSKKGICKKDMVSKVEALSKKCGGSNATYNSIIITFSGHGSYRRDRSGDEDDGYDEELVFSRGRLVDDDFNKLLMKFPEGTRVLVIIDACHSGTMGDLACTYRYTRRSPRIAQQPVITRSIKRGAKIMPATVVMISGSLDYQTSADAYLPEPDDNSKYPLWESQGACTNALLQVLHTTLNIKILELQFQLNNEMEVEGFSQCPTVSSSRILPAGMSLF